jgi:hypothetical protein
VSVLVGDLGADPTTASPSIDGVIDVTDTKLFATLGSIS